MGPSKHRPVNAGFVKAGARHFSEATAGVLQTGRDEGDKVLPPASLRYLELAAAAVPVAGQVPDAEPGTGAEQTDIIDLT